jgi:hypothetical protein
LLRLGFLQLLLLALGEDPILEFRVHFRIYDMNFGEERVEVCEIVDFLEVEDNFALLVR